MAYLYGKGCSMIATEKITFHLPAELKLQAQKLKEELHVSMATIYTEAIREYIQKQEALSWQKAAEMAAQDEEYLSFVAEMENIEDDIYEY